MFNIQSLLALVVVTHVAVGFVPPNSQAEITVDGEVVGYQRSSSSGVVLFESDQHGWFEVGVVPIPPDDCPDLVPTNVQALAPCDNGAWIVRFRVENLGNVPAGAFSTRVSLAPPGGAFSTRCTPDTGGLGPNGYVDLECTVRNETPSEPVGDWQVWILVDRLNQVAESDETNNEW